MAIGDDTAIDYTNKIIDLTGTTVYDVSVLYSYCKEQFKLSANIDDDFAWTANTAVDFTLKNGWYLRTHSIRRLKNGGIRTAYGLDEIEKISFQSGGYTNAVESDIGKTVTDDAAGIGELVDFDNTRLVWWVRTSGTSTTVAASSTMAITTGTGAGTSTGTSVGSTAGEDELWTNFNTIGDLAATGPQPLIYVYTGDTTDGDFNGNARKNSGWEDDPDPTLTNTDRGVFDGLIRIKDMGTTLGNPSGEVRLYGRQGLDKFADFPIDGTAGGRIAVPISQANDTEDTIGEKAICVDGRNANDFTANEIITWTGGNSAEVVQFIEGANSTNGVLVLRGMTAHLTDGVTVTGDTSSATGVTRGSAGGILVAIDAETTQVDEADYGNVGTGGTSGGKGYPRSHLTLAETGTGTGYIVFESNHDYKADSAFYTDFQNDDNITGTGYDVTVDTTNTTVQRLAFDLDHVQIKLAAWDLTVADSSTFTVGMNITDGASFEGTILEIPDATSVIVSQNDTNTATAGTLTDSDGVATPTNISATSRVSTFNYALPLQSNVAYNGLINCNGATAAQTFHYIKYFQQDEALSSNDDPNSLNTDSDYLREVNMMKIQDDGSSILQNIQGEEFFRADTDEQTPANNPTDQSPDSRIAVKPGASITTGEGWALINIASADANNYVLTGTDGSKNTPFASVNVTLTNLVSGYHVEVVLDDGAGQEDTSQITAGTGNAAGGVNLHLNASLPNDTPTGSPNDGVVKMIDVSSTSTINKEMRYRYSSYATGQLTLITGASGTVTAPSALSFNLIDSAADFGGADDVVVGDPIRNTTDGSIAWIKEITSATQLVTTALEGGGSNDWATPDAYETNTLVVAYANGTDTGYIPYMDRTATSGTETETITFVTNRNVVIRVRDESIIDFDTTSEINSSGMSVGAVQNSDSVYAAT